MFFVFLTSLVNASSHTKCISLSNQKCKIQPTVINLHPNEYSQELHYYPFAVKLDKYVGSCSTLNDLSNRVCVKKTEASCECKCKFDERKCTWDQWWNNDKCRCDCKKHHICEKYYIWNPTTCSCETGKYLANIMDDSTITCDEIIQKTKTIPTNFN